MNAEEDEDWDTLTVEAADDASQDTDSWNDPFLLGEATHDQVPVAH